MGEASDGRSVLAHGLSELGLDAGEERLDRLLAYRALVQRWSRAYNLVSPGDMANFVVRHLLDCASVARHVHGHVLDAGSGAGLPGIPLAILLPECRFALVESSGKKVRFLRQVCRELELQHVEPVHARLEDWAPGYAFDTIISRAFASLLEFAGRVRHLCKGDTRLLAMKGQRPDSELAALPGWLEPGVVEPIVVPHLHAARHLVIMQPARIQRPPVPE